MKANYKFTEVNKKRGCSNVCIKIMSVGFAGHTYQCSTHDVTGWLANKFLCKTSKYMIKKVEGCV